jgi:uncharacterized membrane protein YdjX (TVP38/TMEM64 family)
MQSNRRQRSVRLARVDQPNDSEAPTPTRSTPGPMLRFVAVVAGVLMVGMGRAVEHAGGAFGVVLGVVIQLVGVLIAAIAIGAVERLVHTMRRRAAQRPR